MPTLNQRGAVQFLVVLLLLGGIVAGVYLVQQTQIFKPKATSETNITFVDETGNPITETSSADVLVKVTSPQWTPVPTSDDNNRSRDKGRDRDRDRDRKEACREQRRQCEESCNQQDNRQRRECRNNCRQEERNCQNLPTPTPTPIQKTTISIGLAEDPNFTINRQTIDFTTDPISYTFSDSNPGLKTLYAKFIASDGQEQNANPFPATITVISHNVSCTGVLVEGGVQGGLSTGGTFYTVESGGELKLTAQVNPVNGSTATWTVVGRSTGYPSDPNNGGFFDYPGPGLSVNYTAPTNSGTTNDNLNIESHTSTKFSDGYIVSTACPLVGVNVKPIP